MSFIPFVANTILRAADLNAALGTCLPITGGVVTGVVEGTAYGSMTAGPTAGNQATFHAYGTDPGLNLTSLLLELYLTTDRRATNSYGALSTAVMIGQFEDSTGLPAGLEYNSQLVAVKLTVATSRNNNGFTALTSNAVFARPSQYASDAAAITAWTAQTPVNGVKPPLTPATLENVYTTTGGVSQSFLRSSIKGTLAVAENDVQENELDDTGARNGWSLIVDQKDRTNGTTGGQPSGGPPATFTAAFQANAIAGAFAQKGFETGDNVLYALDSTESVVSFVAVVTLAVTAASWLAATGTTAPSAAPTPPSGGTVLHVDNYRTAMITSATPSSPVTTLTLNQVAGCGLAFPTSTPVASSHPQVLYVNGNPYTCVGCTGSNTDPVLGPINSGTVTFSTPVSVADATSGNAVVSPGSASTQGGGIGAFTFGAAAGIVSTTNPFYCQVGSAGNVYECVGVQPDGPGSDGGYLIFSGTIASGDLAHGQFVTRFVYAAIMEQGHRVGLEPTGQSYLSYSSVVNNNNGGANLSCPLRINSILELAGGTAASPMIGVIKFNVTGSMPSYQQYNPYNNTYTLVADGGTVLTLDGAGNLTLPASGSLKINSELLVGERQTGWTAGTYSSVSPNRGTMNYDTATTASLAARLLAVEQALFAGVGSHGLIGVS